MRRTRELTAKEKGLFEILRQWMENSPVRDLELTHKGLRVFFQDVPIDDIRVVEDCEDAR